MDKYYSPNENIKEYYIVKTIGEGRYGIAYLAENNQKEKYVIKQFRNNVFHKFLTLNKLQNFNNNYKYIKYRTIYSNITICLLL